MTLKTLQVGKKMRRNVNLNMKTKRVRSNNERQISLDILIHEKAASVSAQSPSVIQSRRLWREKGDRSLRGLLFKAA